MRNRLTYWAYLVNQAIINYGATYLFKQFMQCLHFINSDYIINSRKADYSNLFLFKVHTNKITVLLYASSKLVLHYKIHSIPYKTIGQAYRWRPLKGYIKWELWNIIYKLIIQNSSLNYIVWKVCIIKK